MVYIYKSSNTLLTNEINNMIYFLKTSFQISNTFPFEILISVMRPYLYLYCIHKYSVHGTDKRSLAFYLLQEKMIEFYKINPKFGRRYIHFKTNTSNKMKKVVRYSTKHPIFTLAYIKKVNYEYIKPDVPIHKLPFTEIFFEEDYDSSKHKYRLAHNDYESDESEESSDLEDSEDSSDNNNTQEDGEESDNINNNNNMEEGDDDSEEYDNRTNNATNNDTSNSYENTIDEDSDSDNDTIVQDDNPILLYNESDNDSDNDSDDSSD